MCWGCWGHVSSKGPVLFMRQDGSLLQMAPWVNPWLVAACMGCSDSRWCSHKRLAARSVTRLSQSVWLCHPGSPHKQLTEQSQQTSYNMILPDVWWNMLRLNFWGLLASFGICTVLNIAPDCHDLWVIMIIFALHQGSVVVHFASWIVQEDLYRKNCCFWRLARWVWMYISLEC